MLTQALILDGLKNLFLNTESMSVLPSIMPTSLDGIPQIPSNSEVNVENIPTVLPATSDMVPNSPLVSDINPVIVNDKMPSLCPDDLMISPSSGVPPINQCLSNQECQDNMICCFNGVGHICIVAVNNLPVNILPENIQAESRIVPSEKSSNITVIKHGLCPPYIDAIGEHCQNLCEHDGDCPNEEKCCTSACTRSCTSPMMIELNEPLHQELFSPITQNVNVQPTGRKSDNAQHQDKFIEPREGRNIDSEKLLKITPREVHDLKKPGVCPAFLKTLSESCEVRCHQDFECPSNHKCCHTHCGSVCIPPESNTITEPTTLAPAYMTVMLPMCDVRGGFHVTQCNAQMCWCVDKYGMPRPDTFTRGAIVCNENGIIAGAVNPVCPDKSISPEICKDTCLNVQCPAHPDAICRADPCKRCDVTFVDSNGIEVQCAEKCHQPMKVGSCSENLPRWYFNNKLGHCEFFVYNGCDGNDNNFMSQEECESQCHSIDRCSLPRSTGDCGLREQRWYFNQNTQQCEFFAYGGCNGNRNNFVTRGDCEATCPGEIICPKLSATNQLTICDVREACAESSCPIPLTSCSVDPCTCKSTYVDLIGNPVNCSFLPTKCQNKNFIARMTGDLYQPQCDDQGNFIPIQCHPDHYGQRCWCVDESGQSMSNIHNFPYGTRSCAPVRIKRIMVDMNFPLETSQKSTRDKRSTFENHQLVEILHMMFNNATGVNMEHNFSFKEIPHGVNVNLLLSGDKAVNMAYYLEERVRAGKFVYHSNDLELEGSPENIKFVYIREDIPVQETSSSSASPIEDDVHFEPASFARPMSVGLIVIVIVLSVLAILVVVTAIIIVLLYHKRKSGTYDSSKLKSLYGEKIDIKKVLQDYDLASKPALIEDNFLNEVKKEKLSDC